MESTFASRIRQYRQERNLSQQALAELCGLTQGNIAHMENGTEPKQSNISKLIAGLPDLSPDWLLTGNGPMLRDGRALTPVEAPALNPDKVSRHPQATRAEFLPISTANTVDAALLQEVSASREKAWEAAALAQRDAERAWTAAEQWRMLYFNELGILNEQQPTPEPEPAPPGKADADSHAANDTPATRSWVGMPRRDADGFVLMHSDNFALLTSGELTDLLGAHPQEGLSTIGVDEQGKEAA